MVLALGVLWAVGVGIAACGFIVSEMIIEPLRRRLLFRYSPISRVVWWTDGGKS